MCACRIITYYCTTSHVDCWGMASPVTYNAPSVGSEPFNSQMEEADRYFTRRRQQFEAAVAARKSEGGVRLRPLSASASQPSAGEVSSTQGKIQKMHCVGPETFPSPFQEELAKGSSVAEEFAKMFPQACSDTFLCTLLFLLTQTRVACFGPCVLMHICATLAHSC